MTRCLLLACLCIGLWACARQTPSPVVDLDEYVFQQSLKDCEERARALAGDSIRLFRMNTFDQCMAARGYEPSAYAHLWINL